MTCRDWLTEDQTAGYQTRWKLRRILHEENTGIQYLQIVETEDFGRALVLDGCIQTTVGDEFIYHEMMAHVPLTTHPRPERVLVIGGGDGGIVREALKHPSVRKIDLVEIDAAVIAACQKYLPETAAALNSPRVQVHVGDGVAWVQQRLDEYDVILVDSSDPEGPAGGLFDGSFYRNTFRALRGDGLLVCQVLSPFFHQTLIRDVYHTIADYFPISLPYLTVIPTYPSGLHCFMLGSKKYSPLKPEIKMKPLQTRWYSHPIHQAAFTLPPLVHDLLQTVNPASHRHG